MSFLDDFRHIISRIPPWEPLAQGCTLADIPDVELLRSHAAMACCHIEVLQEKLRDLMVVVSRAFVDQMGGTPDLFYPDGYGSEDNPWEAWEEDVVNVASPRPGRSPHVPLPRRGSRSIQSGSPSLGEPRATSVGAEQ